MGWLATSIACALCAIAVAGLGLYLVMAGRRQAPVEPCGYGCSADHCHHAFYRR